MKKLPLVLGLFVVVAVGLVLWALLDQDEAPDDVTIDGPVAQAPDARSATDLAPVAASGERTRLEVAKPVAAPVEAAPDAVPESYRRALGAYVGRVVEDSGAPVPQIRVAIVGGGPATFLFPRDGLLSPDLGVPELVLGEAVTDAEGRFRIAGVETRVLGAVLVDPGGPRAHFAVLEQVPESGVERDLGDIVLPSCVTLTGIVVDERDAPVPGVRVRAIELPSIALESGVADFRAGSTFLVEDDSLDAPFVFVPPPEVTRYEALLPIPTTRTDADGRFELPGVRVGLPSVVLDDGVHETRVFGPVPTGAPGGTRDLGRVPMADGQTLVARVLDERNEPVAGAEVMLGNRMSFGPVTILRGPFTSGPDGRVAVGGMHATLASGAARTDPRQAWTAAAESVSAGSGQELSIVLVGARTLVVEVVDPSGALLEGVRLLGRAMPDEDAEDVPDFLMRPAPLDDRVAFDDEGRATVSELSPAVWEIVALVDGWSIGRQFVNLVHHDDRLRIALEPVLAQPIQVVRAGSGEPVEHALVTVYGERWGTQLTTARTKSDGTAQLAGLREGDYSIEVVHPGLAVTRVEARVPSEQPIVVPLRVGGRVSGIVLDHGAPPSEPLLILLEQRGDRTRAGDVPRMTLSDLGGEFEFADVEPGNVRLSARERIDLSGSLTSWWEPFAMTGLAEADTLVESDQETEVVLVVGGNLAGMETGIVHGRLLVNGRPAEGWKIRTWGRIRRSATTAADGSFDMGSLAAGEVELLIGSPNENFPGASIEVHRLELQPDADEYVEIRIETGSAGGRVVDALTNQPLEGARVSVRGSEDRGRWGRQSIDVTDPDGRYAFETLGAGTYVAEVEMDGFARQATEPFEVPALGLARVPDVRLARGVRVAGKLTLVDATGTPQWIWMNAATESGSRATCRPDRESLEFAFDDLSTGTWEVSIFTNTGVAYEPVMLVVTGDTETQQLVFRPEAPPPQEAGVDEALEELGYAGEGG